MSFGNAWFGFNEKFVDILDHVVAFRFDTPVKSNMEPQNGTLEKQTVFGNYHFQVLC